MGKQNRGMVNTATATCDIASGGGPMLRYRIGGG